MPVEHGAVVCMLRVMFKKIVRRIPLTSVSFTPSRCAKAAHTNRVNHVAEIESSASEGAGLLALVVVGVPLFPCQNGTVVIL